MSPLDTPVAVLLIVGGLLIPAVYAAAARRRASRPKSPVSSQVTFPPAAVPAKTCPPALRVHLCAAGCGAHVGRGGWVCGECIRQGWVG